MPVYLPPISRRRFLGQTLTAVAALSLGQGCVSPGKSTEERWALLSDIHIAADPATVAHDSNMTAHLQQVVKEVNAWPQKPDRVLVNGDLAYHSGEASDYGAVTGLLEPLRKKGLPIHLSLGNHDNRERFWEALRDDKTVEPTLANKQAAILTGPCANWFVLDSLMETLHSPGMLGEQQRAWLAQALDANPGKPAIIATHHNAPPSGSPLLDTKELLEILRPRRQVKAWFFGHTHKWEVRLDKSDIHLINLPAIGYVFDKPNPTGWVAANIKPDSIRLELSCIDKKREDHGMVRNLSWRA